MSNTNIAQKALAIVAISTALANEPQSTALGQHGFTGEAEIDKDLHLRHLTGAQHNLQLGTPTPQIVPDYKKGLTGSVSPAESNGTTLQQIRYSDVYKKAVASLNDFNAVEREAVNQLVRIYLDAAFLDSTQHSALAGMFIKGQRFVDGSKTRTLTEKELPRAVAGAYTVLQAIEVATKEHKFIPSKPITYLNGEKIQLPARQHTPDESARELPTTERAIAAKPAVDLSKLSDTERAAVSYTFGLYKDAIAHGGASELSAQSIKSFLESELFTSGSEQRQLTEEEVTTVLKYSNERLLELSQQAKASGRKDLVEIQLPLGGTTKIPR
jgi:hypothetical protein